MILFGTRDNFGLRFLSWKEGTGLRRFLLFLRRCIVEGGIFSGGFLEGLKRLVSFLDCLGNRTQNPKNRTACRPTFTFN